MLASLLPLISSGSQLFVGAPISREMSHGVELVNS